MPILQSSNVSMTRVLTHLKAGGRATEIMNIYEHLLFIMRSKSHHIFNLDLQPQ